MSQDPLFRPFKDRPDQPNKLTRPFRRLHLPRTMSGCLIVFIGVFACGSITMAAANLVCYANLSQRLPIYPGATIDSREHNLFTEFGMGNTIVVLTTPDSPDAVRSWYAVHTSDYLHQALAGKEPMYTLAQGQVDVDDNPDGAGSQVILFGTCVQ